MPRIQIAVFITHLAGWLLFLSLPLVFITNSGDITEAQVLSSPLYWLCFACFGFIFYLHTYLLIPLLYRKQRKFYYFLSALLLVLFILWLCPFDHLFSLENHQPKSGENAMLPDQFAPPGPPPNQNHLPPPHNIQVPRQPRSMPIDIISFFMLLVCMAVGFTLNTANRLRMAAQQTAKAEVDKANAELSFLKAQINPHFLFNTLNNLYSLALTNNEATADAILMLSNIMRYVTDEVHEDFVPLQSEINCITDFTDLQRLRAGSKVVIDYALQGDIALKKIPPLILTTFIENTFKYGISNHQPCTIVISIKATADAIGFFCSNQIFEHTNAARKGTGITNAKKRLAHLYKNKYSLAIDTANNIYTVNLVLQD